MIAVVAVLAATGALAFFTFGSSESSVLARFSGTSQAPASIETFLRGNANYDADLVWSSYSDDARQRFATRGASLDELRRQLATARERGTRIEDFSYIGGQQLQNGTTMYFYLARVVNGQTQGQREYVPYVFTLDASGKIARVQ